MPGNMLKLYIQIHERAKDTVKILVITLDQFSEQVLYGKTFMARLCQVMCQPPALLRIVNGCQALFDNADRERTGPLSPY